MNRGLSPGAAGIVIVVSDAGWYFGTLPEAID